jgi:acetyl-CoA acetyltransferase
MRQEILEKNAAITGIGQSEVGRPSDKSALRLTLEASLEAIADAGLTRADIDGIACWPGDYMSGDSFSPIGTQELLSVLGLKVDWYCGGYEGPGPLAAVFNAAMAVATGLCKHVLVYRTITEASARAKVKNASVMANKIGRYDDRFQWRWHTPFKVMTVVNHAAMFANRHFHDYGTTPEQMAQIAITCRNNAALNPKAVFRQPFDLDDYLAARMISTPLRLLDCDVHCDAATAVIVSRRELAVDMPNPPLRIEAIGASLHQPWAWDQVSTTEMDCLDPGRMMWSRTDLKPKDVQTAQLYDGFSILTMIWLEGLGLCPLGESGPFIEGGQRIALDGELPINTNGGQLSGGRTHGMGYVHEACTQLWGRGEARQIKKQPHVAVTAAGGGPLGGCMLLVRD